MTQEVRCVLAPMPLARDMYGCGGFAGLERRAGVVATCTEWESRVAEVRAASEARQQAPSIDAEGEGGP